MNEGAPVYAVSASNLWEVVLLPVTPASLRRGRTNLSVSSKISSTTFLVLQKYHQLNRSVKSQNQTDPSQHTQGTGKALGSLPNVLLPSSENEYLFAHFAMHLKQDCSQLFLP